LRRNWPVKIRSTWPKSSVAAFHGKIMKADIAAAVAARASQNHIRTRKETIIPFTGMRKVIADRMMQSLQGMAQANHRMKVDMTELVRFREKLKEAEVKVSFTDIFVKVVSRALLNFPLANASLTDSGIVVRDYVNMGVAVAVANGLIVPVIKDADLMTLPEIATISAELIVKAKNGQLQPDDYIGGTFTITNLGMFDIDEFTAIINPPESAILAIGKINQTPVAVDGAVVMRPIMALSLTYDHRVIDGAPAAQFLQRVKQIMQNPYLLI
jgi:pyruvate dehydrogenase E2 component (dihydrolipoamide acetyltransferase)